MKSRSVLLVVFLFSLILPSGIVFAEKASRDDVRHIPANDVIAMDQMYSQMESQGLFIDDPGYRAEVGQAASMARASQQVGTIREANNAARTLVNQRMQTEYEQAVQGAKDVLAQAGIKIDDSGIGKFNTANSAAQALIGDEIAHLESQGDSISPQDRTRLGELKNAANVTKVLGQIAATVKTYEDLSNKREAADRGGTKEGFDLSAAVVKELLTQVKTLADARSSSSLEELITSRSLPASLDGMSGEAIAAHFDKLHASEASRDTWRTVGGQAADAIKVIDAATSTVDTIDKMLNDKDFERIQSNEYASDGAKDMAQMALASGEALRGLASALGGDLGNPAAQILTAGGEGLRAIGNAVNTGARLEEIKRQGGMGGIESNFQAALDGMPSGIRIRQDQEDGTILVPDGSGDSAGTVSLPPDKLNDLLTAMSVFATLQGRNPTQEEINMLAAGGRVPVDGQGQMSMNALADPLRRTGYDMDGARRAEQDAFINQAIGDLLDAAAADAKTPEDKQRAREDYMNENFTTFDTDTGTMRPMTQQEIRERLEELRDLDQERGGNGVTPNMLASDLLNDGAVGSRMLDEIENKNNPDNRSRLEQLQDAVNDPSLSRSERDEKQRELLDELERIRQANEDNKDTGKGDEEPGSGSGDDQGGDDTKDDQTDTSQTQDSDQTSEDDSEESEPDPDSMSDAELGEAALDELLAGPGCSIFGPSTHEPRSVSSGNGFKRLDNLGGSSTRRGPETGEFLPGSPVPQAEGHHHSEGGGESGGS